MHALHARAACTRWSRAGHVPVTCRSRAGQSQLRQLARHLGLREPECWACITLRGTRGGRQHHVSMPAARDSQHGWQPGLISRWVSAVGEPGLVFRGGRWRPLRAQLTSTVNTREGGTPASSRGEGEVHRREEVRERASGGFGRGFGRVG
eukprot:CAMPEP_0181192530 /NCGR_PEP_ID=MMETSP1096-20121128/13332_1 /TAXON_ID=156174 ORGANISM="Chrysochromulina ericina, Strain CCMP281" /NCGR_SAMPLE_ID=MMETSP1096 /ASSEMBLY_ACC=CAM_ASM_000453 /LENGTH=149 /DNA_ID=CAMNT_0023281931 /DNA_START=150 /DNA_END=599 /DNA_ORIENTATION=-